MSHTIYQRAVSELFHATYGRLEDRDRIKVVQLFDRLLAGGYLIHVDELRRLCKEAGYDEAIANDIGLLYDTLCLVRHELEDPRTIDYWPPECVERMIMGGANTESG